MQSLITECCDRPSPTQTVTDPSILPWTLVCPCLEHESTFQMTCMARSKAYHRRHQEGAKMTSAGDGHGAGLPQFPPRTTAGLCLCSSTCLGGQGPNRQQKCSLPGCGTQSLEQARGGEAQGHTQPLGGRHLSLGEHSLEVNSVFSTASVLGRALF